MPLARTLARRRSARHDRRARYSLELGLGAFLGEFCKGLRNSVRSMTRSLVTRRSPTGLLALDQEGRYRLRRAPAPSKRQAPACRRGRRKGETTCA
jgi:hypothetical protein